MEKSGKRCLLLAILLGAFLTGLNAEDAIRSLDQNWQFIWNQLVPPADQTDQGIAAKKDFSRPLQPSVRWDQHIPGYSDLPVFGYGTYLRKVEVDPARDDLALEIGNISTASRIFWNGKEIASFGVPADNGPQTRMDVSTGVFLLPRLPEGQSSAWLAVQAANFQDHFPGMQTIPRIGPLARLQAVREVSIATTYMTASLFLIMGIYHIFLFLFRRDERSPLYFALICLLLSLRVLCTDRLYLTILFPAAPMGIIWAGSYLTFALLVPAFTIFVTNLFRYPANPLIRAITTGVSGLYSLAIIFLPVAVYSAFLLPFQIFCLMVGVTLSVLVVLSMLGRRAHAGLFSLGFFVVFATTVFDILKTNLQWDLPGMVPVGMVVFVFVLALVLSRRAALVVLSAERLSHRLQRINASMIRFVPRSFLTLARKPDITTVANGDSQIISAIVMVLRCSFPRGPENDPAETFAIIQRFFGHAGEIIRKHGGSTINFRPEGLEAVFEKGMPTGLQAALELGAATAEGMGLHIGLEHDSLLLGIVGEEQHLNAVILGDAMQRATRLAELGATLGARVILSQGATRALKDIENYQFRVLGEFVLSEGHPAGLVAEFFDSDPPGDWNAKRATKKQFELAVHLALKKRRADAVAALKAHLAGFPGDRAARHHLAQITKLP